MFYSFLICNLIISVNFSLQAKFGDGRRQLKFQEDSKQESNEINKTENVIKKSDLQELIQLKNQYMVKNCIEEFEIQLAFHFVPNWSNVNSFDSPVRQDIEIRRQKWHFIFKKSADSAAIKRLNLELKKYGINQTTFCDDIAEIYFTLSDNAFIFDKERNSENKLKSFPFVLNPSQEKSILAFMTSIYNFKNNKGDKNGDMVQIPKEFYIELMRKDAQVVFMQHRHNRTIQRLKKAFRQIRFQVARDNAIFISSSELSSY